MRNIWIFCAAVALACSGTTSRGSSDRGALPTQRAPSTVSAPARAVGVSKPLPKSDVNPQVAARFERYRARYEGLSVPGLKTELQLKDRTDEKLRFDPAAARYFDVVARELKLTAAERALLRKQGVVSVDHVQAYSMGSAYYAIYTRDLPVFVTTDSILHALHRSYDQLLKDLEVGLFTATIDSVLSDVHAELGKRVRGTTDPSLLASLRDIDLYLTVARNLLAGAGAPLDQSGVPVPLQEKTTPGLLVGSEAGMDKEASAIIDNVASLRLQTPETPTRIYGGARPIDYSQFRPRGHYTEILALKTYFRAMMWLGRADTGWVLAPPDPQSGLQVDVSRERRNAAILAHLLDATRTLGRLTAMSSIIDFMVGGADNLSPQVLVTAASRQQLTKLADFADDRRVAALFDGLGRKGSQQIRSQVLDSDPNDPAKVSLPALFQLFGQRFLIDSFVLSKVVYDSITFENFLIVAVDNDNDRAIYVGPVYSYYEFTVPPAQRLTDEEWLKRLEREDFPKRPAWIDAIQPAAAKRQLGPEPQRQYEPPSAEVQQKRKQLEDERGRVWKQLRPDTSPKERERIEKALRDIQNKLMRLEGSCRCPPGDDDCSC